MLTDSQNSASSSISMVTILPPADVFETLAKVPGGVKATILDPWYNRGVGGVVDNYGTWLESLVCETASLSDHIFLWGFPEIVGSILGRLPKGYSLTAWLTWYYKNCPSVIRGWRSAQFACLHLSRDKAPLYPEHFLNEAQLDKLKNGKLRYIPGPPTVIESPLNIGFVGKSEQTGHPAQKPMKVIEPLILMTTKPGDLVLDPMCGSGTTGEVCMKLGRDAVLCDESAHWLEVTKERISKAETEIVRTGRSGSQSPLFTKVSSSQD